MNIAESYLELRENASLWIRLPVDKYSSVVSALVFHDALYTLSWTSTKKYASPESITVIPFEAIQKIEWLSRSKLSLTYQVESGQLDVYAVSHVNHDKLERFSASLIARVPHLTVDAARKDKELTAEGKALAIAVAIIAVLIVCQILLIFLLNHFDVI